MPSRSLGVYISSYKWFYKLKCIFNVELPKFNARLVAKCFKQTKGIDFEEIFSPMIKMSTLESCLVS